MIDDVVFDVLLGGADDADGLVEREVDLFFLRADQFAVDTHFVAVGHLRTQARRRGRSRSRGPLRSIYPPRAASKHRFR